MRVLTIASRKGGSGKSTLAAHLSVLAEKAGARVLLIDIDPQGSLAYWWRLRDSGLPALVECKATALGRICYRAQLDGYACAIIDTPPHAEPSILDAMRAADLVLVPTRPGPFDLAAVAATLSLAGKARKIPWVVINHAPPASAWGEPAIIGEAREAVAAMDAPVLKSVVANRVVLSHAIISGRTVGEFAPSSKAAREIGALWRELKPKLMKDN